MYIWTISKLVKRNILIYRPKVIICQALLPSTLHLIDPTMVQTANKQNGKQHTVNRRNPANQLRLVVYPIIYKVLYIPGGAGFLPSAVPSRCFSVDGWNTPWLWGAWNHHIMFWMMNVWQPRNKHSCGIVHCNFLLLKTRPPYLFTDCAVYSKRTLAPKCTTLGGLLYNFWRGIQSTRGQKHEVKSHWCQMWDVSHSHKLSIDQNLHEQSEKKYLAKWNNISPT